MEEVSLNDLQNMSDVDLSSRCSVLKHEYMILSGNIIEQQIEHDLLYDKLQIMRTRKEELEKWHEEAYTEYMREGREKK